MSRHRAGGFTLVELLVVIAIIGTLVALLLPAVQAARESGRNTTCKNNLKQISMALLNMDANRGHLPGYVNALVEPTNKTIGRRASWVVMIFPYMEQQALWDQWSAKFAAVPNAPAIGGFICPSNPPDTPEQPWLHYVVNAGWAVSDPNRSSPPPAIGPVEANGEYLANGVFTDVSLNGSILADASALDGRESRPELVSSISYVQSNDGTSKTLMVSESVHTWYWAYDANVVTAAYEYGANPAKDNSPVEDSGHIFGFVWSNSGAQIERINGDNNYEAISPTLPPPNMAVFAGHGEWSGESEIIENFWESYGFPSSRHSSGVNAVFCDGHIVFLSDTIAPQVYAQLMTSNRNKSKYWDPASGAPDRKLTQPADADY